MFITEKLQKERRKHRSKSMHWLGLQQGCSANRSLYSHQCKNHYKNMLQ